MLISPKTPRRAARRVTDVARRKMNLRLPDEEGGRTGAKGEGTGRWSVALSKWTEVRDEKENEGEKKNKPRPCSR